MRIQNIFLPENYNSGTQTTGPPITWDLKGPISQLIE